LCQFENEDGALFCEQCKSDLAATEAIAIVEPPVDQAAGMPPPAHAEPLVESFALAPLTQPVAAVAVDETAVIAAPVAQVVEEGLPHEPAPTNGNQPVPLSALEPTLQLAPEPPAAPPAPAPAVEALLADAKPKLVVFRGQKINAEYPLYEGDNYIGRADDKPVDVDLEDQEPPDRIWSSRQHAIITFEGGRLAIEDLSSTNGTFVNRTRVHPGQKRPLQVNDVIQIGTVQMRVKI
jgi:hypothetical protein